MQRLRFGTSTMQTDRIEQTRQIVVPPGQAPERIDRYITRSVLRATRNRVQAAIDTGAVLVNGLVTKANYRVRPGDSIVITLMKPPPIALVPQDIPLDIVFEDEDLFVVNKPSGMVTHPGFGNREGTLVNAALFHVGGRLLPAPVDVVDDLEEIDEDDIADQELDGAADVGVRPGIVHRLDKETSGLMVVAKNAVAQAHLARQVAERTARREYHAVAWGSLKDDEGEIEGNIARDSRDRKRFAVVRRGGRYALTRWRVVRRFPFATLIALRLATGRTHQIRVHCAHIGHPLFGDPTYGGRNVVYQGPGGRHRQHVANLLDVMRRQALHARSLGFSHPRTNEWMEFERPYPDDMQMLVELLGM